jgi:hypothetical protein
MKALAIALIVTVPLASLALGIITTSLWHNRARIVGALLRKD